MKDRRSARMAIALGVAVLVSGGTSQAEEDTPGVRPPSSPRVSTQASEATPGIAFVDIEDSTFTIEIVWLATVGITKGCNPPLNDAFCPDDPVTRGQMAAFLVRALGLTDDGGGNTFADDDGSVFEADIAKLAADGITKGCNPPLNDLFCPDDPVTRGQMAAFLYRALAETGDDVAGVPSIDSGDPTDIEAISVLKDTEGSAGPGGDVSEVGELPPPGDGEYLVYDYDTPVTPPPFPDDLDDLTSIPDPMPAFSGDLSLQVNVPQSIQSYTSGWLDYNNLPYAVGQLLVWYGTATDGTEIFSPCSGTLVWTNVVLTVAHCVAPLVTDTGQIPALGFYFIPDKYGAFGEQAYWWGTRRVYHAEFEQGIEALDYAVVVFDQNSAGLYPGDIYPDIMPIYMLGSASLDLAPGLYEWDGIDRVEFGYPAEGWFGQWNSEIYAWPWYCQSTDGLFYNWGGGFYQLAVGCVNNGGSSGGAITQAIDGTRYVVSVTSQGGIIYSCADYGLTDGCLRWVGFNVWGPPLLNTAGDYGFDDVWNVTFNSDFNGGF